MIAALIYQEDFRNNDEAVAEKLGLPLGNYKSRRDTLLEFLEANEFTEDAYRAWAKERSQENTVAKIASGSVKIAESCCANAEIETPSLAAQAKSFYKATKEHVKSGRKNVSTELLTERTKICEDCGLIGTDGTMKGRCQACGCFMLVKAKWATSKCVLKKW